MALLDGLEAASRAPVERGVGGFGTDEMAQWVWGLRHMVRIDSIIAPFLDDSPALQPSRTCFQSRQETYLWSTGLYREMTHEVRYLVFLDLATIIRLMLRSMDLVWRTSLTEQVQS